MNMKYLSLVVAIIVTVNCTSKNNLENTHTHFQLKSGNLMSDISEDFLGNNLMYPEGDPLSASPKTGPVKSRMFGLM